MNCIYCDAKLIDTSVELCKTCDIHQALSNAVIDGRMTRRVANDLCAEDGIEDLYDIDVAPMSENVVRVTDLDTADETEFATYQEFVEWAETVVGWENVEHLFHVLILNKDVAFKQLLEMADDNF